MLTEWLMLSVAWATGSPLENPLTLIAPTRAAARYREGRRRIDGGRRRRNRERRPSAIEATTSLAATSLVTTSAGTTSAGMTSVSGASTAATGSPLRVRL